METIGRNLRLKWQQYIWLIEGYARQAFCRGKGLLTEIQQRARMILKDIWRKWDTVRGCPLPEGVERVWEGSRHSYAKGYASIVWSKTREPWSG